MFCLALFQWYFLINHCNLKKVCLWSRVFFSRFHEDSCAEHFHEKKHLAPEPSKIAGGFLWRLLNVTSNMNRRPLRRIWRTIFTTWYSKTTIFPSFFPLHRPHFTPQEKTTAKGSWLGSPSWHGYDICWLDAAENWRTSTMAPYSGTWKYQPCFLGDDLKSEKTWFNWIKLGLLGIAPSPPMVVRPTLATRTKTIPHFEDKCRFLVTKTPFVEVQGTWRNKCLTWEKLSYIREGSWWWWWWWWWWSIMISCTKDIQWCNLRMKGIFSGPQHWDYFESGMSSVKVHSSRATAKHIDIEPYSLYHHWIQGTLWSYDVGERRQKHILMVSQTQTSSKRFLMNIFNLTEKKHKSSS